MNIKERLTEAAVGGATGLLVVGIYVVGRAHFDGADAGDWLNFAGVIFGVALTVGATKIVDAIGARRSEKMLIARYRLALTNTSNFFRDAAEDRTMTAFSSLTNLESIWQSTRTIIEATAIADVRRHGLVTRLVRLIDDRLRTLAQMCDTVDSGGSVDEELYRSACRSAANGIDRALEIDADFDKKPVA